MSGKASIRAFHGESKTVRRMGRLISSSTNSMKLHPFLCLIYLIAG